ncbi:DNA polymerase III subunit gamma/tau domain-containing protein [Streptomyces sp. YIM S03343]
MAWRVRLRRRTGAGGRSGDGMNGRSGSGGPAGDVQSAGVSDAPGSVVPGDWDGGWRRSAPPRLTISSAPLGVSDGLTFRAGLAAWQNPSFDSGLGHALLPTAPTGLVRGVTRPAGPRATSVGGGPLLLRAVRTEGADGPEDGPQGGASDSVRPDALPTAVRRTRASGSGASGPASASVRPSRSDSGANRPVVRGGSGDTPQSRDITFADSPAVLSPSAPAVQRAVTPSDTGRPAAPAPIPLVRRVAVLPGVAGANPGRAFRSSVPGTSVQRTGTGTGTADAPPAQSGGQPEVPRATVRPRSVGPHLTVARRVTAPVRHVPALRPATTVVSDTTAPSTPVQRTGNRPPLGAPLAELPSTAEPLAKDAPAVPAAGPALGPVLPVVQRQTEDTVGTPSDASVRNTTAPSTPVQRTGNRPPLGAPLAELPSTAEPLAKDAPAVPAAGPAVGPVLPVVQRQTEDTVGTPSDATVRNTTHSAPNSPAPTPIPVPQRSGARTRGGLGAPLPAMPPSVGMPGATASGARASRTTSGPDIQRPPVSPTPGGDRTPPAEPAPDTAPHAADAPLLGTVDVQRHPAPQGSPTAHGTAPATPLVTPSPRAAPQASAGGGAAAPGSPAGNVVRPDATSAGSGPGNRRPQSPAVQAPVVARAVSEPTASARVAPEGTSGPRRATEPTAGPRPAVEPTGSRSSTTPIVGARPATEPTTGRPAPQGTSGARPTPRAAGGPQPTTEPTVGTRPAAKGASGARPAAGTAPRPATRSLPVARRTLALLPARSLTLSTRAPEGPAPSAASRPGGGPPVVAARWSGAPDGIPGGTPAPSAGAPARPMPAPSVGAPVTPPVQRAVTAHAPQHPRVRVTGSPGAAATAHAPQHGSGGRATGAPGVVQRVPVVKPAPPGGGTGTAAVSAARPLPMAPPLTPPLTDGPSATSAPAPEAAVPVVRPRAVTPGPRSASGGGNSPAAPQIQRAISGAGRAASDVSKGVPAKAVPARGEQHSSETASASGRRTERPADAAQGPGLDLDDLARRLLDPMVRLLRTELRRGRERTGRPYDGRR